MIFSAAGALVFIALLLIGRLTGGAIIVGLFASLAFGSTAIVAIPALGNSSPLIYTIFALLLIAKAALEQKCAKGLLVILSRHVTAVVACVLAVYALASAIILPRLFANELSAFIADRK